MSSLQFKNYLKNYSKQLLASSLVWFIGMLLVGYAISNSAAPDQLSELRFIPVYAVAFLSTLCVGLCHYLYWQDATME